MAPDPLATVRRVQDSKVWDTWKSPYWVSISRRAELRILGCLALTSRKMFRFQLSPQDPSEYPEDPILEPPGTSLGGVKGP